MASTSQALPPTLPSLSTPKDARVTLPFSGSLYPSLGQPVLFWCSLTGHEGALPPPCIVRKDPRVPHTARRGA